MWSLKCPFSQTSCLTNFAILTWAQHRKNGLHKENAKVYRVCYFFLLLNFKIYSCMKVKKYKFYANDSCHSINCCYFL